MNETKRPKIAIVGGGRNAGRTLKAHIEFFEELETYRAIGTIEDFKVLKEKSVAKKPIKVDSGVYDYECDYECPKCKNNVNEVEHCSYCDCGQKLDWSE